LELDFIRGTAALTVAIYHWLGKAYVYSEEMVLFQGAPFAVDIFFILSGFVMSYAYGKRIEEGKIGLGSFALLRIGRLYPLIVISSTLAIVAYWIVYKRFLIADTSVAESIFMNAFLFQGILGKFDGFIGVFWSIGIEFWVSLTLFYGVTRYKAYFINFLIVLTLLFYAYGGKNSLFFGIDVGAINDNIRRGLLGVGLGIIAYQIYLAYKDAAFSERTKTVLTSLFYLLFFLIFVYMIAPRKNMGGVNNVFVEALVCAMVTLGALLKNQCKLFCAKWQSWLGDISYSVYIFHMFVVWLMARLIKRLDFGFELGTIFGAIFVVIVTCIVSHYSHKYIEKPAYKWFRGKIGK
jgi:peptidoglycan/LPS O-acetylase OafA/YrhL